jgi:hypothetical protein
MVTFTKEQIKEISGQLDCGFRAFYHKQTGELIFVPDTDKNMTMETDAWQEEIDKLHKNFLAYQEIDAMESRDSFQVMADFAEQLIDKNLKDKLINALSKKNPFREFKFVIDSLGEQRQNWFDFKNNRYIEWTETQLRIQKELNEPQDASH